MALSTRENKVTNLPMLNTEENTFRVLQETLYPGSTDQEVSMILGYCKARKIDPILKPVHLVPMSVKTDKKDKDGKAVYERKNVIMPGIGLYRIDASRTGQYAGLSEPEFGEEVTEEFANDKVKTKVSFPKWCKITIKKILSDGSIAEFTAKEYWKENYASKSKWDETPNDMWSKRAYGQLAKCAEAQVLRKAFPDIVGNEYTKEEMEGKLHFHDEPKPKSIGKTFEHAKQAAPVITPVESHEIGEDLLNISWCENIDLLQETYTKAYKYWANKKNKENIQKLMEAKDRRKSELENDHIEGEKVNTETGEIS